MSLEDKKDNNTDSNSETFLMYNMAVGKIRMANMQWSEDTKEMVEVAVMGALVEVYNEKDVYERVLSYMQENDLYERYARAILELQFNPPQVQKQAGSGEGGEGNEEKQDGKASKDKQTGDGGVSTKTDKNKEISKKFIEDMFRIDDSDF